MSENLTDTNQTNKQPVVWCCQNPDCKEHKFAVKAFEFESDYAECPKCGAVAPTVYKRTLIHLVVKDRKGPIQGQYGRLRLACDAGRVEIATIDNGEAGTDQIALVNCPGCLAAAKSLVLTQGKPIIGG